MWFNRRHLVTGAAGVAFAPGAVVAQVAPPAAPVAAPGPFELPPLPYPVSRSSRTSTF